MYNLRLCHSYHHPCYISGFPNATPASNLLVFFLTHVLPPASLHAHFTLEFYLVVGESIVVIFWKLSLSHDINLFFNLKVENLTLLFSSATICVDTGDLTFQGLTLQGVKFSIFNRKYMLGKWINNLPKSITNVLYQCLSLHQGCCVSLTPPPAW